MLTARMRVAARECSRPRRTIGFVLASTLLGATMLATAGPAAASQPLVCPRTSPFCVVSAENSSTTGNATGRDARPSPGKPVCRLPGTGEIVPCRDPAFGSFSSTDGCYYKLVEPQPPASDPSWQGHFPAGAVYSMVCLGNRTATGSWVWRATAPPGVAMTPAQLAQRAVRLLPLRGPEIGMAPAPGSTGLVGVPVWMWTAVTPSTWGPISRTAAVTGLSVTATARAARIVWSMGDGHSVTCAGPGTPYAEALGSKASPTCGYVYAMSSVGQPGEKYTVTATTTWNVTWAGGGQTGAVTVTRSSTTQVGIGELQVLVR